MSKWESFYWKLEARVAALEQEKDKTLYDMNWGVRQIIDTELRSQKIAREIEQSLFQYPKYGECINCGITIQLFHSSAEWRHVPSNQVACRKTFKAEPTKEEC